MQTCHVGSLFDAIVQDEFPWKEEDRACTILKIFEEEAVLLKRPVLIALFVALAPCASLAESVPVRIASDHYELYWSGDKAEAEDMSKVLELAWTGFKDFFKAAPRLRRGERLTVRFLSTYEAFQEAIRKDGFQPPQGGGGYYCPGSKTAYLYRQPTVYYTRCLLIHEACHQFHYLSRTNNRNPSAYWYIEGVVEHLSWHMWDGDNLVLGICPLSLKDYPAAALKALESGELTLKDMIRGKEHRPLGAMLVRYLVEGEKGRLASRFTRLAKGLDARRDPVREFQFALGDPDAMQSRFLAWLQGAQEPWTPVFNEWEIVSPGRFWGHAKGVTSGCRLKRDAVKIEATLETPQGRFLAGLLLHHQDKKNFTVLYLSDKGVVSVRRSMDGKWQTLASEKVESAAGKKRILFKASRESSEVTAWVDGIEIGPFELPGSRFGLALDGCEVHFRDVKVE